MKPLLISRRHFLKGSTSAIAIASFPSLVLGQTNRIRLEWQQFKTTPQYSSFLNALRTMRANTNQSSPASWQYWVNVHLNYCPHSSPYFLAWHRGYLYYFEQQLRTVSGDSSLTLPYWDYYKYPRIPSEFTDPATGNPLYQSRSGTNVYSSLTLNPFSSRVVNFQRGTTNAFEPAIESAPHNPVHNLIGGIMATMSSPTDPIFYLHHANIDRLWYAWVRSGGKKVPYTSTPYNSATSSSYWSGTFTYASGLTIAKSFTYTPPWLNYDNANDSQPTSLPPSARLDSNTPFKRVQAQMTPLQIRPATGNFPAAVGRVISATKRSLGGAANVVLNENSASAHLPVAGVNIRALQDAVSAAVSRSAQATTATPRSVKVVLDNLQILGSGKSGGYFYNVYINLPATVASTDTEKYFLGTVGAFEIDGAAHHGSTTLEYPATEALSNLSASELQDVTISFVRVDGENAPRGNVLRIGEVRIEVSTDAPWDNNN